LVRASGAWASGVEGTGLPPAWGPPRARSAPSPREDGSGLHRARRCETRRCFAAVGAASHVRPDEESGCAPSFIRKSHFLAAIASYDDVMSLSVRRGFLWPAVDLYGGFAGFYDYGHNGVLMRRRWEDLWIETFL